MSCSECKFMYCNSSVMSGLSSHMPLNKGVGKRRQQNKRECIYEDKFILFSVLHTVLSGISNPRARPRN